MERQVLLPTSASWSKELAVPAEDESVEVRLTVRNQGRLARHLIKVVEECPFDEPCRGSRVFIVPSVKPGSSVTISYTAACYRRGHYPSATTSLETGAPLGLFVRRRRYEVPLNVTVYPVSYKIEEVPISGDAWADQGHPARAEVASEIYGSREYHYGDSLRYIHWRNTARLGELVVKQFEETRQGSVALAFETGREWGEGRETTLEYSIKIAASLARHCGDSGRSIGILAGPTPLPKANYLEAMDYLAGLAVEEGASLDDLTAAWEAGQTLISVVPATESPLITRLLQLSTRGGRLIVVVLEGFAKDERSYEFVSQLDGGNINLVRCHRGDLKAAIDMLGYSWGSNKIATVMAG